MPRDDDEGFNFDEIEAEPEAPAAPAQTVATTDAPGAQATAAPAEALPEAEVPPPEDDNYRRPVQLYRLWVRPKFLQYRYMYEYRTNYYSDVIEYLDKRAKGVNAEPPRAQTWAERVLRTHTNPLVIERRTRRKKISILYKPLQPQ